MMEGKKNNSNGKVSKRVIKNDNIKEFGQITFRILGEEFKIPVKVRVQGRFIPDFTIDPTKPSKGPSILDIIQPKVTILVGDVAYTIDYTGKVTKADPSIFERPTTLDRLREAGVGPVIVFTLGAIFLYKLFNFSKRL